MATTDLARCEQGIKKPTLIWDFE